MERPFSSNPFRMDLQCSTSEMACLQNAIGVIGLSSWVIGGDYQPISDQRDMLRRMTVMTPQKESGSPCTD